MTARLRQTSRVIPIFETLLRVSFPFSFRPFSRQGAPRLLIFDRPRISRK